MPFNKTVHKFTHLTDCKSSIWMCVRNMRRPIKGWSLPLSIGAISRLSPSFFCESTGVSTGLHPDMHVSLRRSSTYFVWGIAIPL